MGNTSATTTRMAAVRTFGSTLLEELCHMAVEGTFEDGEAFQGRADPEEDSCSHGRGMDARASDGDNFAVRSFAALCLGGRECGPCFWVQRPCQKLSSAKPSSATVAGVEKSR